MGLSRRVDSHEQRYDRDADRRDHDCGRLDPHVGDSMIDTTEECEKCGRTFESTVNYGCPVCRVSEDDNE